MSKSKEKGGFQLRLFSIYERKEMKIYFNNLQCKIKQIVFPNYRDGDSSSDFVSFRFFDDKGRDFSIYGFTIHGCNGEFYLEQPRGIFVEGSLWKEIHNAVIGEYIHRFPDKAHS